MSRSFRAILGVTALSALLYWAFAAEPELVICDEITAALDVSVQASVLELLTELREARQTSYVFVSHDLAVVQSLSDSVAVLRHGRVCEYGCVKQVYANPAHDYTKALFDAVLEPRAMRKHG